MRGELALMVKEIEHVRSPHGHLYIPSDTYEGTDRNRAVDILCFVSPGGWFEQNKIRFSRFFLGDCLPVADVENRQISPKAAQKAQANLSDALALRTPYNFLETVFLWHMNESWFDGYVAANKFAYAQESVDLARVGDRCSNATAWRTGIIPNRSTCSRRNSSKKFRTMSLVASL